MAFGDKRVENTLGQTKKRRTATGRPYEDIQLCHNGEPAVFYTMSRQTNIVHRP